STSPVFDASSAGTEPSSTSVMRTVPAASASTSSAYGSSGSPTAMSGKMVSASCRCGAASVRSSMGAVPRSAVGSDGWGTVTGGSDSDVHPQQGGALRLQDPGVPQPDSSPTVGTAAGKR